MESDNPGVEIVYPLSGKTKEVLPLELIAEIAKWCYDTGNHP